MKILNFGLDGPLRALTICLGPTLVVVCPLLILVLSFSFFSIVLPYQFPLPHQRSLPESTEPVVTTFLRICHIIWTGYLLISTGFHFYMCVTTDPNGHNLLQRDSTFFEFLTQDELELENGNEPLMCHKCQDFKPERAHHCSICDRCVLKMDHHCPWINNCVGHSNHRYFVLFIGFAAVALVYFTLMAFSLFWKAFIQKQTMRWPFFRARRLFLFSFLVSVLVGGALIGLLGWHIYLIATGQTTIEFYRNQVSYALARMDGIIYTNKYDKGFKRNVEEFFNVATSPFGRWTILLPVPVSPLGSGKIWDQANE